MYCNRITNCELSNLRIAKVRYW